MLKRLNLKDHHTVRWIFAERWRGAWGSKQCEIYEVHFLFHFVQIILLWQALQITLFCDYNRDLDKIVHIWMDKLWGYQVCDTSFYDIHKSKLLDLNSPILWNTIKLNNIIILKKKALYSIWMAGAHVIWRLRGPHDQKTALSCVFGEVELLVISIGVSLEVKSF